MTLFLRENGTSDYIQAPSITADTIEIDCVIPTTQTNNYATLIDARSGLANGHVNKSSNVNAGWSELWVNGVQKTSKLWTDFATGQRVLIKLVAVSTFTDNVTFFTNYTFTSTNFCAGDVYKITFYLSGGKVAEYNFSTGTANDQIGTAHATLNGGTFLDDGAGGTPITVNAVVATSTTDAITPTVSTASSVSTTINAITATLTADTPIPTVRTDSIIASIITNALAEGIIPILNAQVIIGTIQLKGEQSFNSNLVGKREFNINLQGKQSLNVNLKGLIQ